MADDFKNENEDRIIRVQRGVLALGIAVVPERLVKTFRTSLDDMRGMEWIEMPFSLARSIYDTIELYIIQNKIRTAGQKLIVMDRKVGVLKVSPFGEKVLKILGDRIAARERLSGGPQTGPKSAIIVP